MIDLHADPELERLFNRFVEQEVKAQSRLDGRTRMLAVLSALVGSGGTEAFRLSLEDMSFISFLVPLTGIALGFDAINSEYQNRTLGRLLSQPIYRDVLLFGKALGALVAMALATKEDLQTIAEYSLRINTILCGYLSEVGIELVDFKLEFGKLSDGTIILADEISPDTCRFWDAKTGMKLDKDRFRRDLGGVEDAYREVQKRLLGE